MTKEPFEEALRQFMAAVQDAWTPADIRARGESAQSKYARLLQEPACLEVQQRLAEVQANYIEVVRHALQQDQIRQLAESAYQRYVRQVKDAWNRLDSEPVTASTLQVIGQGMLTAAWIMELSNTGGNPSNSFAATWTPSDLYAAPER